MPVYCSHYTDEETEAQGGLTTCLGSPTAGSPVQCHGCGPYPLLDHPASLWVTCQRGDMAYWMQREQESDLGAQRCFWVCFIYLLRSRCLWICCEISPTPHCWIRHHSPPAAQPLQCCRDTPTTGLAPRVICWVTVRKLPPFLNLTSLTVERRLKSSCRVMVVTDGRCHCINYHSCYFCKSLLIEK